MSERSISAPRSKLVAATASASLLLDVLVGSCGNSPGAQETYTNQYGETLLQPTVAIITGQSLGELTLSSCLGIQEQGQTVGVRTLGTFFVFDGRDSRISGGQIVDKDGRFTSADELSAKALTAAYADTSANGIKQQLQSVPGVYNPAPEWSVGCTHNLDRSSLVIVEPGDKPYPSGGKAPDDLTGKVIGLLESLPQDGSTPPGPTKLMVLDPVS